MLSAAALSALPLPAATRVWAQAVDIEPIIVTATRREMEARSAPAATTIVSRQEIERKGATAVAELLRDVPGVIVDDSSFPGMKRIKIRGEDARRGMVLIDGQEISDHTTYGPPILIDPALIERIEVVRGPLSVLYGSKAIGGVVNIITRRPAKRPVEFSAGGGFDSSTNGYGTHMLASGTVGHFNYRAFFARNEDGNRRTPAGVLPNSSFNSRAYDLRLGYDDGQHRAWIGYDRHELQTQSSTPPGLVDGRTFTKYQLDIPRRDLEKWSFNYDGTDVLPGMSRFHFDAFYQTIDRRFLQTIAGSLPPPPLPAGRYDYYNDDRDTLRTIGGTFQVNWNILPQHDIVTGAQIVEDKLNRKAMQTGVLDPSGPAGLRPVNINYDQAASIRTTSIYAQDTWSFAPDWKAIFGARAYWVDAQLSHSTHPTVRPAASHGQRVIASAALVWTPTKEWTLRAGWGQAYVYPTLLQLHTGTIFGSAFRLNPNPNLQPELSDTFELGARWNSDPFKLDASLFHGRSKNYIASIACTVAVGIVCPAGEFVYVNATRAESYGAELAARYRLPVHDLEIYGAGTLVRRKLSFQSPAFSTFSSGTPLASGRIGLRQERSINAQWSAYWDVFMRAATPSRTRTSRAQSRSGGWATINLVLGGAYIASDNSEHRLSLELLNLNDKRYKPSPDEMMAPGRMVRLNWRSVF